MKQKYLEGTHLVATREILARNTGTTEDYFLTQLRHLFSIHFLSKFTVKTSAGSKQWYCLWSCHQSTDDRQLMSGGCFFSIEGIRVALPLYLPTDLCSMYVGLSLL